MAPGQASVRHAAQAHLPACLPARLSPCLPVSLLAWLWLWRQVVGYGGRGERRKPLETLPWVCWADIKEKPPMVSLKWLRVLDLRSWISLSLLFSHTRTLTVEAHTT